jgi:hypothetical protein
MLCASAKSGHARYRGETEAVGRDDGVHMLDISQQEESPVLVICASSGSCGPKSESALDNHAACPKRRVG